VATSPESVLVTIAGSADALPGTDAGSIKVTPLAEYPLKGRGTGGVRCHKFRAGEDSLLLAWVGNGPARAATASGVPADLPNATGKRDGTGTPGTTPIMGLGGRL
jgi:DNA gyrase subunit A